MKNKQIPVYVFTGFLEGGKTKFIQETLEDDRFNTGERTLLLVCEEGEEEYDFSAFNSQNVYLKVVDEKEDLTKENLTLMTKQVNAERVLVEYNGMWMINDLLEAIPDNWDVYQMVMLADATTFLTYNANMRSLVYDKVNACELVAFNRFKPGADKMPYHQVIRAISRRCDIVYDYTDGTSEFDDIEDPLPFDVDAEIIKVEDRDFALLYRDIMENMKVVNRVKIESCIVHNGKEISIREILCAFSNLENTKENDSWGDYSLRDYELSCDYDAIMYLVDMGVVKNYTGSRMANLFCIKDNDLFEKLRNYFYDILLKLCKWNRGELLTTG